MSALSAVLDLLLTCLVWVAIVAVTVSAALLACAVVTHAIRRRRFGRQLERARRLEDQRWASDEKQIGELEATYRLPYPS